LDPDQIRLTLCYTDYFSLGFPFLGPVFALFLAFWGSFKGFTRLKGIFFLKAVHKALRLLVFVSCSVGGSPS
jgi:hypothetical protein